MTYFYEGERMKWDTARDRCVDYGRDLCVYEYTKVLPSNDAERMGYHWTDKDCKYRALIVAVFGHSMYMKSLHLLFLLSYIGGINVKVNAEGNIAIVHDAMSTYVDSIPWNVAENDTLNWFRVFWANGGDYPGSSDANTCEMNNCKTVESDGSCLCKTNAVESTVFSDLSVTKEMIMSSLFIGALGPQVGSVPTSIANDVTAHVVGGTVDQQTVFEVQDKSRTLYLKNVESIVHLEGWSVLPQIYEAESATTNADVKNTTSSATGGEYVDSRYGIEPKYIEWDIDIPSGGGGDYLMSFRYALDGNPRPLNITVNGQEIIGSPSGNTPGTILNLDSQPQTNFPLQMPLPKCGGDCDSDDHCGDGMFCLERSSPANPFIPESVCNTDVAPVSSWDYCVDAHDFQPSLVLNPTGGWDDDWHYSKKLQVSLVEGQNIIRVQMQYVGTNSRAGPGIGELFYV